MNKLTELCDRVSAFSHWKKLEVPGVGTDFLIEVQKLARAAKVMEEALNETMSMTDSYEDYVHGVAFKALAEVERILNE